jgi:hypothetical protein
LEDDAAVMASLERGVMLANQPAEKSA